MASSLPSKFPPSASLTRPPELSKSGSFRKSTESPTVSRPDSRRRMSSDQTGAKSTRPTKPSLVDRRSHAPLSINPLATTIEEPHDRDPKIPSSSPIPIPIRQKSPAPTTPLTAREPKGGHFPFVLISSPERRSNPTNSVNCLKYCAFEPAAAATSSRFCYTTTHRQSLVPRTATKTSKMQRSSHHNSSSPPPAGPLSPLQPMTHKSHSPRRAGRNLQLTSLPRFHPANYQSSEAHSIQPSRNSRSSASQRHLSDAQQKLHQYQRDLVTSATKTSRSLVSQSVTRKPSSLRLHPLGSPGPVTPMTLEGQGDYLAAGSTDSPRQLQPSEETDLVDRFIREESDRIHHPGIHSGTHSPAASPAVDRG